MVGKIAANVQTTTNNAVKMKIEIKPLSVNLAWKGKRYKTDKYLCYERSLGYLLPKLDVPKTKLRIDIVFYFKNPASDIDNPLKLFLDILQKKYGINDKMIYEMNVKKVIDKIEGIEFNIYEL